MGRGIWQGFWVCLFFCGCHSFQLAGSNDPLVEEIANQAAVGKRVGSTPQSPDLILKEIPLKTPVKEAQAIMKEHGFTCWSAVPDGYKTCIHCTAYKSMPKGLGYKIVVKLYYDSEKPQLGINGVEVTVNYNYGI